MLDSWGSEVIDGANAAPFNVVDWRRRRTCSERPRQLFQALMGLLH
jgi:hypothetical protein